MDPGRGSPRGGGLAGGGQAFGDGGPALGQRPAQGDQFLDLLHREGQPLANLRIKALFSGQIHRRMQQRAGWRDDDVASGVHRPRQPVQQPLKIRPPDISPVDHAQGQGQASRRRGQDRLQLAGGARQIQVQARDGQGQGDVQVLAQGAEIGGQHQLHARRGLGEVFIGLAQQGVVGLAEVEHQAGLVHLHPVRSSLGQAVQDLGVDRQ
jgi:hypothetical protein